MIRQQLKNNSDYEICDNNCECLKIKKVRSFESKLDNNSFDPSKFSPPNDFMLKLRERISNYETTKDLTLDKK